MNDKRIYKLISMHWSKGKINYGWNENSIMNNFIVRIINYVSLPASILLSLAVAGAAENGLALLLLFSILLAMFASSIISQKIVEDTQFFEWDERERKKKHGLWESSLWVVFISSLCLFLLVGSMFIMEEKVSFVVALLFMLPGICLILNIIFPLELLYELFKSDIEVDYISQEPLSVEKYNSLEAKNEELSNEIVRLKMLLKVSEEDLN